METMALCVRALALLPLLAAFPAAACGIDSDCDLGGRSYRVALPETNAMGAQIPAILFVHGYRGTAQGVMRNSSLRTLAEEMGAALIAVQSEGPGWEVPNNPRDPDTDGAAEFAYFDAVLADAAARFNIDRTRVVATGFSSGAMMIWNLACARPGDYAGFVPVAGTFWKAPPETCVEPVASLIHIHGDADEVVPLMGRAIGPTVQGEVPSALAMYSEFGDFGPATSLSRGGLRCDLRSNAAGEVLDFCLFEGGHSFRAEHLGFAIGRLREAGRF
jgi:polyhydroxybutyrate depolymerase